MSLKLLKIHAIMRRFNCTEEEAAIIKRTGIAPEPKPIEVKQPEKVVIKPKKVDKKKEIKLDNEESE